MEQAKRLLRDRRLKLYEVSSMVGYQDANYFAKVFRKLTGVIPSQYRNALPEE
ncbi:AraC family transcriptional regulator [Paenibacillus cisolokensis]|uniref:AraC family transcriptional regulator n=1 Tax=Paenibacillus cisolokensis TaxID=1658519 RepID=UPI0024541A1A|nr:AraC family transcriptional regulator [Paenibacillus cisolokensis]